MQRLIVWRVNLRSLRDLTRFGLVQTTFTAVASSSDGPFLRPTLRLLTRCSQAPRRTATYAWESVATFPVLASHLARANWQLTFWCVLSAAGLPFTGAASRSRWHLLTAALRVYKRLIKR